MYNRVDRYYLVGDKDKARDQKETVSGLWWNPRLNYASYDFIGQFPN